MIPFDIMHSTQSLPHLAILKKFKVFFRKMKNLSILFFQKTQISVVLRINTILVAFYRKFATNWWKKYSRSESAPASEIIKGKHRVKKRSRWADFPPML